MSTPSNRRDKPRADLVGPALGAAEDDRLFGVLPLQQLDQQIELPFRIDGEVELFDRLDRQVLGREVQYLRLAHVAFGQPFDWRGQRGAEQQGLPRLRAATEDLLDVGSEADVEHAVGLVQHDNPQLAPNQRAAAHQVQHAARRADDEACALVDLFDLLADRLAAVNGHDRDISAQGQFFAFVADLDSQFAGRHQGQGLRRSAAALRLEHLQDRNREGGRLARARLGLTHHVHTRERAGNEPLLDRGRLLIGGRGQGVEHDVAQSQGGKPLAMDHLAARRRGARTFGNRLFAWRYFPWRPVLRHLFLWRLFPRSFFPRSSLPSWPLLAWFFGNHGSFRRGNGSAMTGRFSATDGLADSGFLPPACGFAGGFACAAAGGLATAGFSTAVPPLGGSFSLALRSAGGFATTGLAACGLAGETACGFAVEAARGLPAEAAGGLAAGIAGGLAAGVPCGLATAGFTAFRGVRRCFLCRRRETLPIRGKFQIIVVIVFEIKILVRLGRRYVGRSGLFS